MAVEKLLHNRITMMTDLQPVEVTIERRSMRLYRQLQETALWDSDLEQWQEKIFEDRSISGSWRHANDQLLGVLIEASIDKRKALARYEKLKQTELYDKEKSQWMKTISREQRNANTIRETGDQLLDVLVRGLLDKRKAREQYVILRQSNYYDPEHEQWLWCLNRRQDVMSHSRYAGDQLLGILVEGVVDKENARYLYEKLKRSELFDNEHGQWASSLSKEQKVVTTKRFAKDQLLGILVAGMFDKVEAKSIYEKLKETELFDKEKHQWQEDMHENQILLHTDRLASDQLLGVMVEKMFEKEDDLALQVKGIPVVRRF